MTLLRSLVPIALLAGVALTVRAQAADLPRRTDPYAASAPAYDAPVPRWSGGYVGAHAGGGFGKSGPANTSGMVVGGQAGYNFQVDKIVIGGEADISASGIRNSSYADKSRQKWLGSARVRAGYAVGNILPYVTGGVAYGATEIKNFTGKADSTRAGWVAGVGAEMMVSPSVTVRAEYLHYGLGQADYPGLIGPIKVDTSTNVLRGGVNYKF